MPKYANKPKMKFSTPVPATIFYAKKPKMVFSVRGEEKPSPELVRTLADGSNRTLSDGSFRTLVQGF